jgi:hypothetical protein
MTDDIGGNKTVADERTDLFENSLTVPFSLTRLWWQAGILGRRSPCNIVSGPRNILRSED